MKGKLVYVSRGGEIGAIVQFDTEKYLPALQFAYFPLKNRGIFTDTHASLQTILVANGHFQAVSHAILPIEILYLLAIVRPFFINQTVIY